VHDTLRTSIVRHFREPLLLILLVFPVTTPPVHPFLPLLIPHLSLAFFMGDPFSRSKTFPLRWGFWFGKRFGSWELGGWRGELRGWSVGRGLGWEGEKVGDESLYAVSGRRLQILF
jgi:hypothetical protein